MEADRYQKNRKLFILSMLSLIVSLSLFAFSFYVLPYLVFAWRYDIPEFIVNWQVWFTEGMGFAERKANVLIFFSCFIPALIAGYISYWSSNKIENEIYGITPKKPVDEKNFGEEVKDTFSFGFRLSLIILLIVVGVFLLEWLITDPSLVRS